MPNNSDMYGSGCINPNQKDNDLNDAQYRAKQFENKVIKLRKKVMKLKNKIRKLKCKLFKQDKEET